MDTKNGLLGLRKNPNWSVVYEEAIREDGSLFFPERLDHAFLEEARRKMGTYLFANQYLNQIFPADDQRFKKDWLKYYRTLPDVPVHHFAFIDPAISTEDGRDYTGIVVVAVDNDSNWYVRLAQRRRLTPTEIVNLCFDLTKEFSLQRLGVETVAYQKALLYMLWEESQRRKIILPIQDHNPGTEKTKEMRILGLVPRFEFGKIHLLPGMTDLERELLQFPKAKNDDIIDALSSLEHIITYPSKPKENHEQVSPYSGEYESRAIQRYIQRSRTEES